MIRPSALQAARSKHIPGGQPRQPGHDHQDGQRGLVLGLLDAVFVKQQGRDIEAPIALSGIVERDVPVDQPDSRPPACRMFAGFMSRCTMSRVRGSPRWFRRPAPAGGPAARRCRRPGAWWRAGSSLTADFDRVGQPRRQGGRARSPASRCSSMAARRSGSTAANSLGSGGKPGLCRRWPGRRRWRVKMVPPGSAARADERRAARSVRRTLGPPVFCQLASIAGHCQRLARYIRGQEPACLARPRSQATRTVPVDLDMAPASVPGSGKNRLGSGRRERRSSRSVVKGADMGRLPLPKLSGTGWCLSSPTTQPLRTWRRAGLTFGCGVSSDWVRADVASGGGL